MPSFIAPAWLPVVAWPVTMLDPGWMPDCLNPIARPRRRLALAAGCSLSLAGISAAPLRAQQPASPPATPLDVGFVFGGPTNEPGWAHQQDLGRRALERSLGDTVRTHLFENVPEGQEAERAIRDLVSMGCRLIFTTAYGFMDPTIRVARDNADCRFENATGYKLAPNVGVYNARFYEGRYLAGLVAGHMSKSGVIGYVAAVPIPEVLQGINAFTMAARTVNPKLEVRVIWANSWHDPAREHDAAITLLSQGADLLTHHSDTVAVAEVAESKGRMLISYHSDLSAHAPTAQIAAVTHHWGRYFIRRTQDVMKGTWVSGQAWGGLREDFVRLERYASRVPVAVRRQVRAVSDEIEAGKLRLFAGPIADNEGKLRVESGSMTDDQLQKMDWLVAGVIGRVR